MQTAYVAYIWFTGRIRLRGWLVIDRDVEPRRFRFFLIGFAVSVPILIMQAIYPPYSNCPTTDARVVGQFEIQPPGQ